MRLLALFLVLGLATAYNCTWRGPYNSFFDLFLATRWGHQGDYHGRGQSLDYRMNFCNPSHTGDCNIGAYGICSFQQTTTHMVEQLGFWSGAQPQWQLLDDRDPRHGLQLTFRNGQPCNHSGTFIPRTTVVRLPCGPNPHPLEFNIRENFDTCHFTIDHPGLANCPIGQLPPPHFPEIPWDYRSTMEVTVSMHNETFWLHEIWDVRKNKVRNDQFFHPGGWVTTLLDFGAHNRYSIINGTQCTMRAISPTERMESVFDLLRKHRDRLRYRGIHESRGILCDSWEGYWTFQVDGQEYYEDATWFFALPTWRVVEDPFLHRRPVSVHMRTNYSRSHLRFPEQYSIHFVEFQPSLNARSEREVELQWQWNCPGGPPVPSRPNTDGMSSGGVAGLSIFMLALGGACGVGGLWYYQKRTGTGGYGAIGGTADASAAAAATVTTAPAAASGGSGYGGTADE